MNEPPLRQPTLSDAFQTRTGQLVPVAIGAVGSVFLLAIGMYFTVAHHAGGVFVLALGAIGVALTPVLTLVVRRRFKN